MRGLLVFLPSPLDDLTLGPKLLLDDASVLIDLALAPKQQDDPLVFKDLALAPTQLNDPSDLNELVLISRQLNESSKCRLREPLRNSLDLLRADVVVRLSTSRFSKVCSDSSKHDSSSCLILSSLRFGFCCCKRPNIRW